MKKKYQAPGIQTTEIRLATVVNGVSGTVDTQSINNEGSVDLSKGRGGRTESEWVDLW